MKTLNILIVALMTALGASAQAEVLATLFPKQGAQNPPKALWNRVLLDRRVLTSQPMFSSGELMIMKKIKMDRFLGVRILTFKDEATLKSLKLDIAREGLPFILDFNDLRGELASAEPFEHLQWALDNRGEAQNLELDFMTAQKVPAVKPSVSKEDINIGQKSDGRKKVRVAILDTGIDPTHPDLHSRTVRRPSECKALAEFEKCLETEDESVKCPEVDIPECKDGTADRTFVMTAKRSSAETPADPFVKRLGLT